MADYRITAEARADMRNIGRYTQRVWGRKQRQAYLSKLQDAFRRLSAMEVTGRERPEIRENVSSYLCGRHQIFHRHIDGTVEILRILHGAQSAEKAFDERPSDP